MNELFQKLENKAIILIDELETARAKINKLITENQELQIENQRLAGSSENEKEKLESILSLLDGINTEEEKITQEA